MNRRVSPNRETSLHEMRLEKLSDFIYSSHHSYTKKALIKFNARFNTLLKIDEISHTSIKTIKELFSDLKIIIEHHIYNEEMLLIPYINQLLAIKKSNKHSIIKNTSPVNSIKLEHRKIEKLLKKIRIQSNNYTSSKTTSSTLKLIYAQLFDFEQDIHKHIFLEENVLFPKIVELEKRIL